MNSELIRLFYGEEVPEGGRELRMNITPENAKEISYAAANFKGQINAAIQHFTCVMQLALDGATPADQVISGCCWGLSGLAELESMLDSIEREADRTIEQGIPAD